MAFGFSTLEDLALVYYQRKSIGIVPLQCVDHGMTTSIYYIDPDGNQIEMQVDHFENNDDATTYNVG